MKKGLIITTTLFTVIALGILSMQSTSNCGGNSAALVYTDTISTACVKLLYDKGEGAVIALEDLLSHEGMNNAIPFGWGVESYWVKNEIHTDEALPVVICAQAFSNVPQPTLWNLYRKSPSHAVSYLDGRTELMRVEEFKKFDLSEYTEIHEDQIKASP